jgi:hypothetical protein
MKHRIAVWGLVGCIVAGCWVLVTVAIPISGVPVLWALARFTCPIVPISMLFHVGVKWYWVIAANIPPYALIGLTVEGLRHSQHRLQTHER